MPGCLHGALHSPPVATMTVSASTDFWSVQTLNGRLDRSTFVTVSEKIWVPKRALWALRRHLPAISVVEAGRRCYLDDWLPLERKPGILAKKPRILMLSLQGTPRRTDHT